MAQRVLAVLGAIGFVLAAIAVRNVIDDDTGDEPSANGDGEAVLVCATDLAAMCDSLDGVRIVEQGAAETAAAIESGADGLEEVDGWVTSSAWLEVVESGAPGRLGAVDLVAVSPTIVAVDPDRADAVTALCAGQSVWECLGEHAGSDWGDLGGEALWGTVKTGLPSGSAAIGLPVLAAAASGFFGGTEFASNDFDPSGFRSWLTELTEPSGAGDRTPITMLVTRRGMYSAVGDVATAALGRNVFVTDDSPVDVSVVLVRLPGADRIAVAGALRDAFEGAGWSPTSGDSATPTLKPGVMAALYTLWTEVTR